MNPPLLHVENLVVRYGRITALDDVSLHVDAGETVAIVGPNGAGKSTLLSAIAGLVRPVHGNLSFQGEPILGQSLERTVRRGIALVPEGRHVFAGLTVLENLRIGAVIRRDHAAVTAEIDRFMQIFPILGTRRDEPAGRLSGGEQQMLVIARALMSDPALLMLDEPSLGLAPSITDQVYELIADLGKQGLSVLVVEQNADRALQAANRTCVINSGRVRLSGPSQRLAADPDFEAAYFGIGGRAA
ncbi:ABC transporter ATP-binding protein [Gemmobacter sp.]|uniref:ABC transporter ATP-binding protein n=1 Tax=Gemmobacter sp. TaxID=1898957 RepID=UPI002AFE187F|nr:ABC transporter ATP-binding protein [Gemmobacter sp.]